MDFAAIASRAAVVPVLTIERTEQAVPLAHALIKGGLPVLEVTLRSPGAIDALRAIATALPEAIVGAGTVLDVDQLAEAKAAGARNAGLPYLPGIQTVSEAMTASEQGYRLLKFFPADAGGISAKTAPESISP